MVRVVAAMSGGVDSSVAAWLLQKQGYEVIGVFMRPGVSEEPSFPAVPSANPAPIPAGQAPPPPSPPPPLGRAANPLPIPAGPEAPANASAEPAANPLEILPNSVVSESGSSHPSVQERRKTCCSASDAADARRVADQLGIPFYVLNFQEEFEHLIEYFVQEYISGRTPNPCIVCNHRLKFGKLFEYADSIGAEYVATGHYARILPGPDGLGLYRAIDETKDQSYVLFGIRRDRLGRILLPLGNYRKLQIRQWAAQAGLRVAEKAESQDICFVPDRNHARLIRQRRPGLDTSGPIVTTDGRVVGHHPGIEHFTIGQRKGLRVALGDRRYVVRIEPESRSVVLGAYEELARWELTASGANWLIDPPNQPFEAQVKIRYRTPAIQATVEPLGPDRFQVRFHQPCYGVAPGQAAVCYQNDRVLGGGWID